MNNLYISFFTNLTLLLIAAKLWGKVEMGWGWVLSPLIAMTVVGILAAMNGYFRKNRMRLHAKGTADNLAWFQDFIARINETKEKERHTVN